MSDQVQGRQLVLGSKVPAVTASFWAIKVLSTTGGETGSDHLAVHTGLGAPVTDLLSLSLLAALLALQLAAQTCVPWRYWAR